MVLLLLLLLLLPPPPPLLPLPPIFWLAARVSAGITGGARSGGTAVADDRSASPLAACAFGTAIAGVGASAAGETRGRGVCVGVGSTGGTDLAGARADTCVSTLGATFELRSFGVNTSAVVGAGVSVADREFPRWSKPSYSVPM